MPNQPVDTDHPEKLGVRVMGAPRYAVKGKMIMLYSANGFLLILVFIFTSIVSAYTTPKDPQNLFPVEVDGKMGYIDKTGKIIIALQFDGASEFSEGMARILVGDHETGSFGYIDATGKIIIKPKFKGAGLFFEGVAIANDGKGPGVIDKNGKYLFRLKHEETESFSEGMAAAALDWKEKYGYYYGFIDKKGKVIIPAKYHHARNISEGLAAVEEYGKGRKRWGKTGYIDKHDQWVIAPQYHRARDFHEGLAAVFPEKKQMWLHRQKRSIGIAADLPTVWRFF